MMKRARLAAGTALALAAALAATGCSSGASAPESNEATTSEAPQELTTIKVATTPNIVMGALFLGIEQGIFEEEGLKVETTAVANPPAGIAAVQSGQVDFAYSPSIPLLNALSQSVPVRVVAPADGYESGAIDSPDLAQVDDTGFYAGAASGITELSQLEGRTIAVPARKAHLEVVITAALVDAGVDPDSVNWVALDYASAITSLGNGTIDAAGLASPFTFQAAEEGAHLLLSPSIEFFREGAVGVWTTGTSTADQKPEVIAAFQRAIVKANAYANENPELAIEAGLAAANSTLTADQVNPPYWPTEMDIDDIERVNEKLVKLGFLPAKVDLDGLIIE